MFNEHKHGVHCVYLDILYYIIVCVRERIGRRKTERAKKKIHRPILTLLYTHTHSHTHTHTHIIHIL